VGQPETLIVGLASNAFDTWLSVLDSGARTIVFNDDFIPGETTNSGVVRTFTPGVYYLEASSFGGRESGPYQIIVSRAP
jgi:hypothetical protein